MTSKVDGMIVDVIRENGAPPVDCPPTLRSHLARELARVTRDFIPTTAPQSLLADELAETGIVRLPQPVLTPKQLRETHRYLRSRPVYNAHVPAQSDGRPRSIAGLRRLFGDARQHPFGSYRLEDILCAPHLLEVALSNEVLGVAESYLGCAPTLYSMNAWWAFGGKTATVTRHWHRDPDDYRFVAFFIFLTDIDDTGGQHVFIKHSHNEALMRRQLAAQKMPVEFPFSDHTQVPETHPFYERNSLVCTGPAGTAFLADTYGVHRALPPSKDRLVLWARYGLHAGRSYVADQIQPISRSRLEGRVEWTDRVRHITRLIVN